MIRLAFRNITVAAMDQQEAEKGKREKGHGNRWKMMVWWTGTGHRGSFERAGHSVNLWEVESRDFY